MIIQKIKKFAGFINESESVSNSPYSVLENGDISINIRSREDAEVSENESEFIISIPTRKEPRSITIPRNSINFGDYRNGIIRILGESKWGFSDSNKSDLYDFLYDFSEIPTASNNDDSDEDYIQIFLPEINLVSDIENIDNMGDSTYSVTLKDGTSINMCIKDGILDHLRAYKTDSSDSPFIDIDRKSGGNNGCILKIGESKIKLEYRSIIDLMKNPIFRYAVADKSVGSVESSREEITKAIIAISDASSGPEDKRTKDMKDLIEVARDFLDPSEIERLIK